MAIEKSNVKVSRFDLEYSHGSGESMSSYEERRKNSVVNNVDSEDEDDDFDEDDSGAGSDDFDLLELAETGAEFCQVGNVTCSIPFELYDLSSLEDILSVDVWNECLTEEERFSLSRYLPDVDQLTFMRTLKELFEGCNFHFGSPVKKLFDMLKGGQCEPRNTLYLEGRSLFLRTKHYHSLRKYHNDMVVNLCQTRDAWVSCKGYSIDEKLRVLNIVKSQKTLMREKKDDFEDDSSEKEEPFDKPWGRKEKDRKSLQKKLARHAGYGVDSGLEFPSRRQLAAVEQQDRYGKPKSKPKFPFAKTSVGPYATGYNGYGINSAYNPSSLVRQRYGSKDNIDDDDQDPLFGMGSRRNREKSGYSRPGKKHKSSRDGEPISEHFMGPPYSSRQYHSNYSKSSRYANNIQPHPFADQMKPVKGSLADLRGDLYRHGKNHGDGFSVDPRYISDDLNSKSKKLKSERDSPDTSLRSYRASMQQMNERFLNSDFGENHVQEKIRVNVVPNARSGVAAFRDSRMFMGNDDTESDSSHGYDDEEERNRLMRNKSSVSVGGMNNSHFPILKSRQDSKKSKSRKKDMQENELLDGRSAYLKYLGVSGEHIYAPGTEKHSFKSKQKGKMRDRSPLDNFSSRDFEDGPITSLSEFQDKNNRKEFFRSNRNSQTREQMIDRTLFQRPSAKPNLSGRKRVFDEDDESQEMRTLVNARDRLSRKYQVSEDEGNSGDENLEARLLVSCNALSKKRKTRESLMDMERREDNGDLQLYPDIQLPVGDVIVSKRKGKKKMEVDVGFLDLETSDIPKASEAEVETKPQKKPFVLITPTVHTGFSFSIVHLLSAVRMAMTSLSPEDSLDVSKSVAVENAEHETGENGASVPKEAEDNKSPQQGNGNLPSLTIQEIVSCVKSNPGDPCILETQEPLQDLIRGVLKIFSSKTSPLGAKGWKPLVTFERSTKCWSWIGPVLCPSDQETVEEVTSPEAWSLPHKMLVKLVDSFANWLKTGQETLQQIGSLPEPPLSLMQCNLDEKERFKDLRAQKSLSTITQSSEEARAYFRKEEFLRYSIPDRAFVYTAADGKKSIVAPLRRGGGKPTSKARDHFMLKRERPPHVTILCLVRDAAARLPGSIGTRADVCTLIRDSQYIVEDVSDSQVNQVVSGALDRLHYERDPCVQFDSERKLWVYLHRDREQEDFEDDGTSSTKKWKRPKKEAAEQTEEQEAVTVAFLGNEEQTETEMGSEPKTGEPTGLDGDQGATDQLCNETEQAAEEQDGENIAQGNEPTIWEPDPAVVSNPVEDNTFICQENSVNDDFDDET
ncbi:putative nuclear factor related to kappa-B-binding protein [Arabidopsis thaliana]